MYYNYIGTWYQGIHSILQNCAISPYDYVIAILGAKYRVLITCFYHSQTRYKCSRLEHDDAQN